MKIKELGTYKPETEYGKLAYHLLKQSKGRDFFENISMFSCGSINGQKLKDKLMFVTIVNDKPHNGDLELFFLEIERQSRFKGEAARIVAFTNERFKRWVLRRPGWSWGKCHDSMLQQMIPCAIYGTDI